MSNKGNHYNFHPFFFIAVAISFCACFSVVTSNDDIPPVAQWASIVLLNTSTSKRHRYVPDEVVVLMTDNRALIPESEGAIIPFYQKTLAINAQYARKNGYQFRWYQTPCQSNSCLFDDPHRPRAPAWARVLAIHEIFQEYRHKRRTVAVMYLDSDAIVSDHSMRVGPMTAALGAWEDEIQGSMCTGAFIVRNNPVGRAIMHDWWNSSWNLRYDLTRQWDQAVFNGDIVNKHRDDIVMMPSAGWTNQVEKGEPKIFWGSGYFPNMSATSLSTENSFFYRPGIQHLWGGLADQFPDHLDLIMNETNSLPVTAHDVRRCAGTKHMWCLVSSLSG